MSVAYVVDGYNLLFYLGLCDRRDGAHALEQARHRLLDHLHDTFAGDAGAVTVVFDSARNRKPPAPTRDERGLQIRYAGGGEIADDLIETLIAQHAAPRQLVVISNDRRIQDAARRRGAGVWSCADFLDHGDARRTLPRPAPRPESERPPLSRAEVQRWLDEFAGLEDDPAFREVFRPFPFEE